MTASRSTPPPKPAGELAAEAAAPGPPPTSESAAAVLRNRGFLLLWLAQVATQIGINMILYALEVVVLRATDLSSVVSLLFLTFLVPSVLFSALAGVFVDRLDRRLVLVVTNVLRAVLIVAIFAAGQNIAIVLLLNTLLSTATVFFAPAEAAMIPVLVPRNQLVAANGIFTLTLNGAFAVGFAFLGPLLVTIMGSPEPVLIVVAILFAIAAAFCLTLPGDPPVPQEEPRNTRKRVTEASRDATGAIGGVFSQLREGVAYIGQNHAVAWSLAYLGVAASLIGVIAVLGPGFARDTLGLDPEDLIVVVLPLGIGIVMGVLLLNTYGKYFPRRRAIEVGLVALGILLVILTVAGPISRLLSGVGDRVPVVDLSSVTSLVSVVIAIAFLCGVAYGIVAISAQVQLQEDIPADVRGRVFGVLNMLISVASILPIIIVGPISDLVGTTPVILFIATVVVISGLISIATRGPLRPDEGPDLIPEIAGGSHLDPARASLPGARDVHGHTHREIHEIGEGHAHDEKGDVKRP
ncbi:MAG TPA: MFS transporter [Candidatus Limnocylindria bacterium]|nr:MFS transporter [Candidatus Limnocylindria bacterium]